MKKVIFIIAQHDFRDEELSDTVQQIEDADISYKIASMNKGLCIGRFGMKADAYYGLTEVVEDEYDAIVFIGGSGASEFFFNIEAHHLARDFFRAGKIVAAICIAPRILAEAEILQGKRVTSFETEAEKIKAKGAIWTGNSVEQDGQIITADGPDAAPEFGKLMVKILEES